MKQRILVVDDTPISRLATVMVLSDLDIIADEAYCASDALLLLKRHNYQLVLMDHDMPGMTGSECVRVIRSRERDTESHVPVVAFTASNCVETKEECMASGMDDFFSKDISSAELVKIVSKWMRKD